MTYYEACKLMTTVNDFIQKKINETNCDFWDYQDGRAAFFHNMQIIGVDAKNDRCFAVLARCCYAPELFDGYEIDTDARSENLDDALEDENGCTVFMSPEYKEYYKSLNWSIDNVSEVLSLLKDYHAPEDLLKRVEKN